MMVRNIQLVAMLTTIDRVLVAESVPVVAEGPKTRYEKLENRINELETMLQQQRDQSSDPSSSAGPFSANGSPAQYDLGFSQPNTTGMNAGSNYSAQDQGSLDFGPISRMDSTSSTGQLDFVEGQNFEVINSLATMVDPLADQSFSYIHEVRSPGEPTHTSPGLEVVWPNWPPNVPEPHLLRHLVELFFSFQPHATRLFHMQTFMASLTYPPSHPKFPIPPVLHAICAVSTLYTSMVSSPPLPNYSGVKPNSFAEQQARFAKTTIDKYLYLGDNLVPVLQAPQLAGQRSLRALSILPPARTVIEDEMRRNTFWLAYATDRTLSITNGWAHAIDDADIAQLLPDLVAPHERQWAHTKNLHLVHPENQTDSFVLYIKGTSLLSQVKNFNLRFRARHYAGDPTCGVESYGEVIDPRTTQAFKDLDDMVLAFKSSFPAEFKNPILGDIVDPHLYSSRATLDLIYAVWSTSYDITLMDLSCTFCWLMAGRVLVRFLKAAQEADSQDQVQTLQNEVEFVHYACENVA
ncbi:hypothetical protein HWV62_35620 [Athelia sp. TMB]|nr:hypothetical protein HWV62_35620 [Athelia sp. TMB]